MQRAPLFILICLLPLLSTFAQDWKTYPYVPEGSVFSFPEDEGRHPDEAIEWWYIAGKLEGAETGTRYNFMLTYFAYPQFGFDGFRILNLSNETTGEFYDNTQPVIFSEMGMDHLAIQATTLAGETEFWTTKKDSAGNLIPFEYDIYAIGQDGSIELSCLALKPPIFLGDSGLFDQGAESYTYYYSQTKNEISGTITFKDVNEQVTGTAWIDRQFGAFNQANDERYEWLYVQLSNGMDLNIWNIFTGDNFLPDTFTFKHFTVSDEEANHYTSTDFELERLGYHFMPDSAMCYAQKWRLTSPVNQLDLVISTLQNNSEVQLPFRFFEGPTAVSGTVNGVEVTGVGFAELLRSYEHPVLSMNNPADTTWNGTEPISWHLDNPDDGRPLRYDLEYSTNQGESYQLVQAGLDDTICIWKDPPLTQGDTCWFRVKGYSIDTTLMAHSDISGAFVYVSESTSTAQNVGEAPALPFILFPNPSGKFVNILFKEPPSPFRYQVFDLAGRMLFGSGEIIEREITLPTDALRPGFYVIHVWLGQVSYAAQFQVSE